MRAKKIDIYITGSDSSNTFDPGVRTKSWTIFQEIKHLSITCIHGAVAIQRYFYSFTIIPLYVSVYIGRKLDIEVPRDRDATFNPVAVSKYKKYSPLYCQ
jgi:hypothetical protein